MKRFSLLIAALAALPICLPSHAFAGGLLAKLRNRGCSASCSPQPSCCAVAAPTCESAPACETPACGTESYAPVYVSESYAPAASPCCNSEVSYENDAIQIAATDSSMIYEPSMSYDNYVGDLPQEMVVSSINAQVWEQPVAEYQVVPSYAPAPSVESSATAPVETVDPTIELKETIEQLEAKVAELTADALSKEEALEQSKKLIGSHKEDAEADLQKFMAETKQAEEAKAKMAKKLTAAQAKLADLNASVVEMKKSQEKAKQDLNASKEQLTQAKASNEAALNDLKAKQQQQMAAQTKSVEQAAQAASQSLAKANQNAKRLEQTKQEASKRVAELSEELQKARSQNVKMRKQIEQLKKRAAGAGKKKNDAAADSKKPAGKDKPAETDKPQGKQKPKDKQKSNGKKNPGKDKPEPEDDAREGKEQEAKPEGDKESDK